MFDDDLHRKSIYIKTEPGGRIVVGKLNVEQEDIIENAMECGSMPGDILDLRYDPPSDFNQCEGVVNSGDDGAFGNVGRIALVPDRVVSIPSEEHAYQDGIYFVYMALSKVSVEFEFGLTEGFFDSNRFIELSVPIRLPDCVRHRLYGIPNYNIVVDYMYDGEVINEYDGQLCDRGYDEQLDIIAVINGSPRLSYTNYNGAEIWGKRDGRIL